MNRKKTSMGRKVCLAVDVIVILLLCLICMVPLLNLLAYSFSASQPIIENKVFINSSIINPPANPDSSNRE